MSRLPATAAAPSTQLSAREVPDNNAIPGHSGSLPYLGSVVFSCIARQPYPALHQLGGFFPYILKACRLRNRFVSAVGPDRSNRLRHPLRKAHRCSYYTAFRTAGAVGQKLIVSKELRD